jgi:hypothetical protein
MTTHFHQRVDEDETDEKDLKAQHGLIPNDNDPVGMEISTRNCTAQKYNPRKPKWWYRLSASTTQAQKRAMRAISAHFVYQVCSMATADPAMATPTLAAAKAGASLTPSPHIRTRCLVEQSIARDDLPLDKSFWISDTIDNFSSGKSWLLICCS